MQSDTQRQATMESMGELLRNVSVAQACQYFDDSDVRLISAPQNHHLGQVLKTHIVLVLLMCTELQIIFKVHFNHEQIRIYRKAKGCADEMLTDTKLVDFMKEFCNQAAGRVSRIFAAHEFPMGMSVPLCTRGLYEIYADYQEKGDTTTKFGDFWCIEGSFGSLYCSCYVEIMSKIDLSHIKYTDDRGQDGVLEFL